MTRSVPILAVALALAACSSSTNGSKPTPSAVTRTSTPMATEKDFSIALDNSSVAIGTVSFRITNNGPSVHEFVIFGTDLDEASLPMNAAGTQVDENGARVKHVDEVENVAANGTKTLSLALDTGRYVAICNLAGHYKLGMHVAFDVG